MADPQLVIDGMRHFELHEFKRPELMYVPFLYWIDQVRDEAGCQMIITSDGRPPEENANTPGAWPRSLHRIGRAIDIRYRKSDLTAIVWAVTHVPTPVGEGGPELGLEVVNPPGGKHIHIGLRLPGEPAHVFVR